jgi:hypothetical protein
MHVAAITRNGVRDRRFGGRGGQFCMASRNPGTARELHRACHQSATEPKTASEPDWHGVNTPTLYGAGTGSLRTVSSSRIPMR